MELNEFFIPLCEEELLSSCRNKSKRQVQDLLSPEKIDQRLQDCSQKLKNQGPAYILEEFDVLYSAMCHFKKLQPKVLDKAMRLVVQSAKNLHSELSLHLENNATSQWKTNMRNSLKMVFYLLCDFVKKFETEATKPITEVIVTAGKGRKKVKKKADGDGYDWETEKGNVMQILSDSCHLPLHVLWDPPILEEEFVNLVTNCCYKILENSAISRNKTLCDNIFCLLGQMVRKHDHTISCSIKILQLIQQYEHLVTPLGHAVELFVNKYKAKSIVCDLIREASRTDDNFLNDSAGTKSTALFLVELSQHVPDAVLANLSMLLPQLEHESHVLRNSVLAVITELVLTLLSEEGLDENKRELRNKLLDHLEDHVHDVNAFVRSRALQLWTRLVHEKATPLNRQQKVLSLAVERLHDKSHIVRKNAVQLIVALLQNNPFASKLSKEELQKCYETECERLKKMLLPEQNEQSEVPTLHSEDCEGKNSMPEELPRENSTPKKLSEDETSSPNKSSDKVGEVTIQSSLEPVELAKQQVLVQYLKDTLTFTTLLYEAIPTLIQLLGSCNNTDVLSAIEFFYVSHTFGLSEAISGIRRMLLLIWSTEPTIKEAVITAYKRIYLQPADISSSRIKAIETVKNLTALVIGASIGELTSLEELICAFVNSEDLDGVVYQVLWERFTLKVPISSEERRIALLLLGYAAGAQIDLVRSNIDVLIQVGFSEDGELDFEIAKYTCLMLLKLTCNTKLSTESPEPPLRFSSNSQMFVRITDLLVKGMSNFESSMWIPFMEKAITLIYSLADNPDGVCENLLKRLIGTQRLAKGSTTTGFLTRLLAAIGQVALNQLTYLDVAVFTEMKRRQFLQELKASKEKKQRKKTTIGRRKSLSASAVLTPSQSGEIGGDSVAPDDELGLVATSTDDFEAEYIKKVCDTEIVTGSNYLSHFAPIIVTICSQPGKFPDVELQTAAVLALSKFMIVSADFCEEHLQLLFTLLEKSTESVIRSNVVIAVGDLAVRFPNLVDPWTKQLYNRLHDPCISVRYTTLTVLSHLLLNAMIKVKGQISDVAICVVDDDDAIVDLAKLFFFELSKKKNNIYNILPDVISRLSDPEVGTEEGKFRKILKFLLGLIQKDRELEGLVEKLCHRFRASDLERQWRDLALCLSLLSYNQKCVQKLLENFACYGTKLVEPFVYECFQTIITNTKKMAKPEVKNLLDELEQQMEECLSKGVENGSIPVAKAINSPQTTKKKPTTARRTARSQKQPTRDLSSVVDEVFEQRQMRSSRARKIPQKSPKPKLQLSDSDDDE